MSAAGRSDVISALEVDHQEGSEKRYPHQYGWIAVRPSQFGHDSEVHAVDAGNECQRENDRRDDGEGLHHVVGRLGEGVLVGVASAAHEVAVGLDEIDEVGYVFVDAPIVSLGGFADVWGVPTDERADRCTRRLEGPPKGKQVPANLVHHLDRPGVGRGDDPFFDALDIRFDGV